MVCPPMSVFPLLSGMLLSNVCLDCIDIFGCAPIVSTSAGRAYYQEIKLSVMLDEYIRFEFGKLGSSDVLNLGCDIHTI